MSEVKSLELSMYWWRDKPLSEHLSKIDRSLWHLGETPPIPRVRGDTLIEVAVRKMNR